MRVMTNEQVGAGIDYLMRPLDLTGQRFVLEFITPVHGDNDKIDFGPRLFDFIKKL